MQLETKHFGQIEIDEKGIIDFPDGVPGFEESKKFVLLGSEDPESMFRWLQSVDLPQLAFAVVDPFAIRMDYSIDISDEYVEKLSIGSQEDILVYSIVVVPEDVTKISMNLKAPVIINIKSGKGAQIVLDTDRYSVRHYIMEELRKQEVAGNACPNEKKGSVYCNKR